VTPRAGVLGCSGAAAVVSAVAIVGPACGVDDITVATVTLPEAGAVHCTVVPSPDGGQPADAGDAGIEPCKATEFCEPATCDSSNGTCTTLPPTCNGPGSFVCGCNKVTYFNDCVRQTAGQGTLSSGLCLDPKLCGGPSSCGDSQVCALALPYLPLAFEEYLCSMPALDLVASQAGQCWGLPSTMPTGADGGEQFRFLTPSVQPCPSQCTDAYTALTNASGKLLVLDPTCP